MNVHGAAFTDKVLTERQGRLIIGAFLHDGGAIACNAGDLCRGRNDGHKNARLDAEDTGSIGNSRAMIAARGRCHAGSGNFHTDKVGECAARLEAAGVLEKLKLEANRIFNSGQGDIHDRGPADEGRNAGSSFADGGAGDSHDGLCRAPMMSRQGWPRLREIADSRMPEESFSASGGAKPLRRDAK